MERIEGLSIGLDLDSLALERGLTGLKDRLKTVNSEMKANMSAFDYGEKSVKKYETRLEGLNKKLEVQKAVTKATKEEYEKMVKEHGAGSKEAEEAARSYNNQAGALNNLQRYVDKTTKELEELRKEQAFQESGWGKLTARLDTYSGKLTGLGNSLSSFGRQMSTKVTAPILASGGAMFKAAMDWESAWAGVEKTVDGTDQQMKKLSSTIREMAKEIPASAEEIAGVAEAAGQLGIETESIEKFTRTMIDLGEATNLSSDQAATEFARFANIVGMSQDDFDRLGSSVVALGKSCCPVAEKSAA